MANTVFRESRKMPTLSFSEVPGQRDKRSVNISAIFKPNKGNVHSTVSPHLQKTPTLLQGGILKDGRGQKATAKKQIRASSKLSVPKFKVHMLEQKCQEDMETWRNEAHSQAWASINSVHTEMNKILSTVIEDGQVMVVDAAARKAEIFKPLDQEQARLVRMTSKGQEEISVTTLGESMRAFQEIIGVEQEKQESLWIQWDQIQAEIVALGLEVLGPEAFGVFE